MNNKIKLSFIAFFAAYYAACAAIVYALSGMYGVVALIAAAALASIVLYAMHSPSGLFPSGLYGVHTLVGILEHSRRKDKTGEMV